MSEREPISSREVSDMLARYARMVAGHAAVLSVDYNSNTDCLLRDEVHRAEELAAYFWDSKHNLREHYVSRIAVLGDLDCDAHFPSSTGFYLAPRVLTPRM